MIGRLGVALLGAHVVRRAEHLAGACHAAPRLEGLLGEPEVDDLDRPFLGEEQVGRFDVAVHDPGRMRGLEAAAGVGGGGGGLQRGEDAAARQPLLHRAPGDELHRQVVLAVLLTDLVDRGRVGVLEARRRLRLGQEAIEVGRVGRELDGAAA